MHTAWGILFLWYIFYLLFCFAAKYLYIEVYKVNKIGLATNKI